MLDRADQLKSETDQLSQDLTTACWMMMLRLVMQSCSYAWDKPVGEPCEDLRTQLEKRKVDFLLSGTFDVVYEVSRASFFDGSLRCSFRRWSRTS